MPLPRNETHVDDPQKLPRVKRLVLPRNLSTCIHLRGNVRLACYVFWLRDELLLDATTCAGAAARALAVEEEESGAVQPERGEHHDWCGHGVKLQSVFVPDAAVGLERLCQWR